MTDNDDRIARLKATAEGMGLKFRKTAFGFNIIGNHASKGYKVWKFESCELSVALTTAESLLASLSPGPVVDVPEDCLTEYCDLKSHPTCETDDCPGPAPPGHEWRLCLLPKEVDDDAE